MEELRSKHMSAIHNAAHQMALECIHAQSIEMPMAPARLFTVVFVHPCLYTWNAQATLGSSYHVHPYPSPVRLQHAFQTQNSPKMFHPKGLKPHLDPRTYGTPQASPVLGRALCLTPRGSPVPGRVSHLNEKFQDSLTLNSDTDALVTKIGAMFPTVSETHIKILLKKYYNREAVVISALQVEKHPITTPGPLTMSPSAARLNKGSIGVYSALQLAKGVSGSLQGSSHFTPYSGTPHGSPSPLRPASCASSYYGTNKSIEGQAGRHHSPKMKLKYLKSIFPKAEETLILDILANKDNNVQGASEELSTMGFTKKETAQRKVVTPPPPKKVVTISKTLEEKNLLREKLQKKYPKIAERVISIALESVEFNEERAEHILAKVDVEDEPPKAIADVVDSVRRTYAVDSNKGPILKISTRSENKYKSHYSAQKNGPNANLRQGPKDSLLLEEYLPWSGPDPDQRMGQRVIPEGPERPAIGPSALAMGPANLAKGSLYKNTKKSAKIVV